MSTPPRKRRSSAAMAPRVTVRIPANLMRQIDETAGGSNRERSRVIRELLRVGLLRSHRPAVLHRASWDYEPLN